MRKKCEFFMIVALTIANCDFAYSQFWNRTDRQIVFNDVDLLGTAAFESAWFNLDGYKNATLFNWVQSDTFDSTGLWKFGGDSVNFTVSIAFNYSDTEPTAADDGFWKEGGTAATVLQAFVTADSSNQFKFWISLEDSAKAIKAANWGKIFVTKGANHVIGGTPTPSKHLRLNQQLNLTK